MPRSTMDQLRLLILLLLPVVASNSSTWPLPATPANVEVDLVFPRANQTYRPVWPFPIVFGIRNASSLWYDQEESADLEFTWKLVGFNDTTDRDLAHDLDGTSFGSERWQPSMEQDHNGQPADDLLLKVWIAARDLVNAPEKHFRLSYQLVLRSVCPGANATQPILEPGQIYFSTDDLIPELPNILPADSCASHAASAAIADMQRTSETGAVCVVPGTNTAPADHCGLKVDAPMAGRIEKEALDLAGCPEGTWPDAELTRTSCNAKSLAIRSTGVPSAIAAFLSAAVAMWGFA